ncbi:MAG TPA: hypothetical protein VGL98_05700 [Gammaproteobacteria bacterium]
MSGANRRLPVLLAVLVAAVAGPISAQNAEPPRAPRILDAPPPQAPAPAPAVEPEDLRVTLPSLGAAQRPPNAARLAPLPLERQDGTEEIIVIGQGWRLPDLGSEWRARQQEAERSGRFTATLLPLFDPERPPQRTDFFTTGEQRRHGSIELFRLRFGRRSAD